MVSFDRFIKRRICSGSLVFHLTVRLINFTDVHAHTFWKFRSHSILEIIEMCSITVNARPSNLQYQIFNSLRIKNYAIQIILKLPYGNNQNAFPLWPRTHLFCRTKIYIFPSAAYRANPIFYTRKVKSNRNRSSHENPLKKKEKWNATAWKEKNLSNIKDPKICNGKKSVAHRFTLPKNVTMPKRFQRTPWIVIRTRHPFLNGSAKQKPVEPTKPSRVVDMIEWYRGFHMANTNGIYITKKNVQDASRYRRCAKA